MKLSVIKEAAGAVRELTRPKALANLRRMEQAEFREYIHNGVFELVHVGHPNVVLADLAQDYEDMLKSPLRKFTKGMAPKLGTCKHNIPAPGDVLGLSSQSPAYHGKYISIPEYLVGILTPRELKAMVAHELGHFFQQYRSFRVGLAKRFVRNGSEHGADQISAYLVGSEHATAMHSALEKMLEDQRQKQALFRERRGKEHPIKSRIQSAIETVLSRALHPSSKVRGQKIAETAQKMETPEGRNFVEQEIIRRIQKTDRSLHPHHYNRPSGNSRA